MTLVRGGGRIYCHCPSAGAFLTSDACTDVVGTTLRVGSSLEMTKVLVY